LTTKRTTKTSPAPKANRRAVSLRIRSSAATAAVAGDAAAVGKEDSRGAKAIVAEAE
jgi:hypothetical protein